MTYFATFIICNILIVAPSEEKQAEKLAEIQDSDYEYWSSLVVNIDVHAFTLDVVCSVSQIIMKDVRK